MHEKKNSAYFPHESSGVPMSKKGRLSFFPRQWSPTCNLKSVGVASAQLWAPVWCNRKWWVAFQRQPDSLSVLRSLGAGEPPCVEPPLSRQDEDTLRGFELLRCGWDFFFCVWLRCLGRTRWTPPPPTTTTVSLCAMRDCVDLLQNTNYSGGVAQNQFGVDSACLIRVNSTRVSAPDCVLDPVETSGTRASITGST